jgi:flagellar hook-length control protein FliK
LTNAVEPAKAAAPAIAWDTANLSIGAGGDGFQQLLAVAAERARAATGVEFLPVTVAATPTVVTDPASAADGNTLPLLIDLLPLTPGVTPAEGEAKAKTKADSDKADKDTKDAADKTAADAGAILITTPLPVVTPPVVATAIPATPVAADTADTAVGGIELATPMLKKTADTAAQKNEIALASGRDNAAATPTPDTSALLNAGSDGAKQQDARADSGSDFDSLVKQFDTPTSTSTAGSVDSGRTVQQVARANVAAAPTTITVSVPVAAEGWGDAVADKVMWFSANKINSAEIHLNPPDLGPIQVRISTQQDQATVYFTSQHASVREALDQALPRLREMMSGHGIQLADAGVGGQSSPRQQEYRGSSDGRPRSSADSFFRDIGDSSEPIAVSSVAAGRIARSGIDAYV